MKSIKDKNGKRKMINQLKDVSELLFKVGDKTCFMTCPRCGVPLEYSGQSLSKIKSYVTNNCIDCAIRSNEIVLGK